MIFLNNKFSGEKVTTKWKSEIFSRLRGIEHYSYFIKNRQKRWRNVKFRQFELILSCEVFLEWDQCLTWQVVRLMEHLHYSTSTHFMPQTSFYNLWKHQTENLWFYSAFMECRNARVARNGLKKSLTTLI